MYLLQSLVPLSCSPATQACFPPCSNICSSSSHWGPLTLKRQLGWDQRNCRSNLWYPQVRDGVCYGLLCMAS